MVYSEINENVLSTATTAFPRPSTLDPRLIFTEEHRPVLTELKLRNNRQNSEPLK